MDPFEEHSTPKVKEISSTHRQTNELTNGTREVLLVNTEISKL